MKIVSFNINSVRARPHQLEHIRDTINPDVIGLQETKVNDPEFPIEVINEIGYHAEYWGQKGHYGVALLSKEKPSVAVLGETATSGGYLIAVAADQIISRSNTLTGSIGVILQYPNLSKLFKNIGIDINTLRSSDLKASVNLFEKPTPKAIEEHKERLKQDIESELQEVDRIIFEPDMF